MRFAYADPPYLGAAKYYPEHPHAADFDTLERHAELIAQLNAQFDGWAYSLSAQSLRHLIGLTPETARVMVWVKPYTTFWKGVHVAYAWEPVIVQGGRVRSNEQPTVRDWISANMPGFQAWRNPDQPKPGIGQKPEVFSRWLFQVLGMEPDDEFVDLFPGSGAVTRAWEKWRADERGLMPEPLAGLRMEDASC